jgi:hypothetical protein
MIETAALNVWAGQRAGAARAASAGPPPLSAEPAG